MDDLIRCGWSGDDALYCAYHDEEWGVPTYDDRELFELLILEGAQAGLSWITILRKRENYRRAFDGFDPEQIAGYDERRIEQLLQDPGIIRNRLKVQSAVTNAQAFLEIQEGGSFSEFIWSFVDGEPVQNTWESIDQTPNETAKSRAMSKELKRRGFRFVGPTICYAYMQSAGLVNDHIVDCHRYETVRQMAKGELQ